MMRSYKLEQNPAVECVMDRKGTSFLVPKKKGVWYKLYKPWDLRENVKFQNFSEDPTVHGYITEQNKEDISYGAGRGHSLEWWRIFIRQCHCLGIIDKKCQCKLLVANSMQFVQL